MSEEIIVRVNGWDLVKGEGQDEPKIRDFDLAERLEYSRNRNIRKLIASLKEDGHLPNICERRYTERSQTPTGGVRETEATEYLLTEEEALLVTTQSKTPKAMVITKEIISVFVALRRGLISGASPDQIVCAIKEQFGLELSSMREETRLLRERVVALDRHPNGLLGEVDAAELRRQINAVAHIRSELGEAGTPLQMYRRVDDAIRREVGYPNEKGAKWELCPSSVGTRAFSRIGMMAHGVSTELAKRKAEEKKKAAERQVELFRQAVGA